MNLVIFLVVLATAVNGLLAGLNTDTALVKLPARHRICVLAYASFARGNDLGNGLVVYPLLGIGAALLTVLATVVAYSEHASMQSVLLLSFASLLTSVPAWLRSPRASCSPKESCAIISRPPCRNWARKIAWKPHAWPNRRDGYERYDGQKWTAFLFRCGRQRFSSSGA